MSTTLTGEPQPMANGKASRVGDALAPPIPDWRHPQAVFTTRMPAVTCCTRMSASLWSRRRGRPSCLQRVNPTRHSACVIPMEKAAGLKISMMLLRFLIACRT